MDYRSLLGTELPIIQAPMAGVQDHNLTIAVSQAGGLGSLPCAMLSPAQLRRALQQISAATTKPVNLNFFCHQPPLIDPDTDTRWINSLAGYYDELGLTPPPQSGPPGRRPFNQELADIVCQFKPRIVSFHFGLPAAHLTEQIRAAGCTVLSSATTPEEAIWLEQNGADAIIAQGIQAGGHRGMFIGDDLSRQTETQTLLTSILATVSLPVIAAGGIGDAKDVESAIRQGATAVQLGTSYLLCQEATTSPLHRRALKSSRATAVTNLFSGRPARGLVNRLMTEQGPISNLAPAFPLATAALVPLRMEAERLGRDDFSPLWSGTNRQGCREVPAAELTRTLASLL